MSSTNLGRGAWIEVTDWTRVWVGMVAYIRYCRLWHAVLVTSKDANKKTIRAIHYAWPGLFSRREVKEEDFVIRPEGGDVWEYNIPHDQRRPHADIIVRARALIGEKKFNMFTRRSSHMILECVLE